MNDRVTLTVEDGIADVRLARADKMNAIDPAMFEGIGAAIDALAERVDVRCVVLSGEGKCRASGTNRAVSCRSTSPGAGGNCRCR
jgi:enoyl-CoA hydratase/carnithine racemase